MTVDALSRVEISCRMYIEFLEVDAKLKRYSELQILFRLIGLQIKVHC